MSLVQVIITGITTIIGVVPATETEMRMERKAINLDDVLDQVILTTMKIAQMIPLANAIVILVHALARNDQGTQGADRVRTIAPWMNGSSWHVLTGKERLRPLMQGHILRLGYLIMMC